MIFLKREEMFMLLHHVEKREKKVNWKRDGNSYQSSMVDIENVKINST